MRAAQVARAKDLECGSCRERPGHRNRLFGVLGSCIIPSFFFFFFYTNAHILSEAEFQQLDVSRAGPGELASVSFNSREQGPFISAEAHSTWGWTSFFSSSLCAVFWAFSPLRQCWWVGTGPNTAVWRAWLSRGIRSLTYQHG